jgi:molecular chaperone DnaK
LQEPIAAAIASIGTTDLRDGYWLIYDLGGGTFDVSLVRARGGRLQVLDHDGDNHLGGKDFDRILARRASEVVRKSANIQAFRRSKPTFAPAFDRLKAEAERVRIALSEAGVARFHVDQVAQAPSGEWVDVDFSIDRGEVEAMIGPTIATTIGLCRQVLDRNNLAPSQLRRVVLVGGPTLTPCLPAMLEADLGAEARHVVDPAKAVAIGAAIYASTQQLPLELRQLHSVPGALTLDLAYEPMTNDQRPMVAGKVSGARQPADWRLRIVSTNGYVSQVVPLRNDGA